MDRGGRRPVAATSRGALRVFDEVRAFDQLHGKEERAGVRLNELVEVHEVAVVHVREGAKLLLEEVEGVRVYVPQCLQGNVAATLPIERLVNDAHTPFADATEHGVPLGPLPLEAGSER
jgi:hypothetical protein